MEMGEAPLDDVGKGRGERSFCGCCCRHESGQRHMDQDRMFGIAVAALEREQMPIRAFADPMTGVARMEEWQAMGEKALIDFMDRPGGI